MWLWTGGLHHRNIYTPVYAMYTYEYDYPGLR
jgi:hypothetical protein